MYWNLLETLLTLSGKCCRFTNCFHFFQFKFPFGDIVVHLARRFLVPSPVSYALKSSTLFVLTKHVNGVALNTRVVNLNFRNALTLHYNFWGYFTSSSNLFYERWIYCFSTHSHRGFKPAQFECILRAMQCVLSALCAKVEVAENNACGRTTASQLYSPVGWREHSHQFLFAHVKHVQKSFWGKWTPFKKLNFGGKQNKEKVSELNFGGNKIKKKSAS